VESFVRRAKKLGRAVRGFNEEIWARERLDIMTRILVSKFSGDLKQTLLDTGDSTIVECSPTNRIWGIGMKPCPEATDRTKWRGLNVLGQALMLAREQLK